MYRNVWALPPSASCARPSGRARIETNGPDSSTVISELVAPVHQDGRGLKPELTEEQCVDLLELRPSIRTGED